MLLRKTTLFVKKNKNFSLYFERFASTLVIAEQSNGNIGNGTLSAVTAANQITKKKDATLLIVGKDCDALSKIGAKIDGVSLVLTISGDTYEKKIAENMSYMLSNLQKNKKFTHILAPSSNSSKNYLPRLGAEINVAPITDVLKVIDENTFKRPMYAGNAIATINSKDIVKIFSIRATGFEKAAINDSEAAKIEKINDISLPDELVSTKFVSEEVSKSDRPDLSSARVVVAGGRGLKNGVNFSMLEKLADKLGGAVGASRAAVDAGFVPNEYQVGQTGKVVAPDFYLAVGISGAIQHLAGMKDSKVIACINKDEEAPIFQVADYGLVDDLFKAVPEMIEKI